MKRDDQLLRSVERLCDLEVEYDMTVRVLAVLVEMYQQLSRMSTVQIPDEAILDQPDLTAWHDDDGHYALRATR